jgi:putative addiction module component (TIGR02574 family)
MSSTTSNIDQAFDLARSLSAAQKIELIGRLWDNIRLSGDFRPSNEDLAEMQRRSAELDSGAVKGIPWDVVRDSIRKRFSSHE